MAHFAELDAENKVIQVIVVANDALGGLAFPESEAPGVAFCQSLFGADSIWKQTSYNNNFRAAYAGVGYIYDPEHDVFYAPSPYPSWVLNHTTWYWEAPVPHPTDGGVYVWDEDTGSWVPEVI